jgi:hypothetical protein
MIHNRFCCNRGDGSQNLMRILSSRHDHAKGARSRKRGGDAPGRGRHGVQAGGLAARSVNILFQVCLVSSPQTLDDDGQFFVRA